MLNVQYFSVYLTRIYKIWHKCST